MFFAKHSADNMTAKHLQRIMDFREWKGSQQQINVVLPPVWARANMNISMLNVQNIFALFLS